MNLVLLAPIAVFFGITLLVWAVLGMFSEKESRAAERLEELKDPTRRAENSNTSASVSNVLQRAAPALSKALAPKTELEQNALKVRLANTGFNSPNAPMFFLAIKMASLGIGVVAGGGFGAFKYGLEFGGLVSVVVGGAVGYYLPELIIRILRSQRMERIFLSLPDALDLLVVCVESGLGLDAAMRRVAEETGSVPEAYPTSSKEVARCNARPAAAQEASRLAGTTRSSESPPPRVTGIATANPWATRP